MAVDLSTRPTERADAYEDAWSSMVGTWWSDGVWPKQLNQGEVFADGTGTLVKIRGLKVNIAGFHGEKTTESSLGLANADPSSPRIDRIVARLDRTKPATIRLDVVTGTPSSPPSPSPLVRNSTTYDIPLAQVSVSAGGSNIQASQISDDRDYAAPRTGDQVGVVKMYLGPVAPEGYLFMAGQTVNKADYPALARMLGVNTPTFIIPDMRGRSALGSLFENGAGTTGGVNDFALSVPNLASHSHGVYDPTHVHPASSPAHGHGLAQSPHGHGVSDPTHYHGIQGDGSNQFVKTAPSTLALVIAGSPNSAQQVSFSPMEPSGTYVGVQAANANVSVGAAAASVGIGAAPAAVSTYPAGSGTPFSLHTPFRTLNFMIKAH